MKYRKFGKLDEEVSVLGFGITQLPVTNETEVNNSINLLRHAIDCGVNYLDLGPPDQLNQYKSISQLINQALADGYRQRIKLAAHLPVSMISSPVDLDRLLDQQLQTLKVTGIDYFFLDGLNRDSWPRLYEMDALHFAEAAIKDGRIANLGFSFRDQFHFLKKMLEDYDNWDLCQFRFSYMDVDRNPGINGIRYAREKGLAVVITEPLKNGLLSNQPPESISSAWTGDSYERTLTEWGLRWVWNYSEIDTIVMDMSTMKELEEIVSLAGKIEASNLSIKEQILINQLRDAYRKLKPIPCTTCRTCMPCPKNIDVPRILELYNDAIMFEDIETVKSIYHDEQHNIEDCDECGSCVKNCGKMIAILDWLQQADGLLGREEKFS